MKKFRFTMPSSNTMQASIATALWAILLASLAMADFVAESHYRFKTPDNQTMFVWNDNLSIWFDEGHALTGFYWAPSHQSHSTEWSSAGR
ncbi:MAG: hypothetical protein D6690_07980 [Nitrospirae bacterium]|nr:MAG: hypothetical protein D6690_07980 [Nitrospirota bacterium]